MKPRFVMVICALALGADCGAQALPSPAGDYARGRQLLWGDEDRENNDEGVAYVVASAKAGHAEAQAYLALMYEIGLFVQANQAEAVHWAQQAASQKHTASMVRLAFYYLHASGVLHDPPRAKSLLEEAAALGDASAMANLGAMYGLGDGVPQSDALAAGWYRKAADLGNDSGRWGLAQMYVRGDGVPLDYAECYYWASLVNTEMFAKAPSLVKLCRGKLSRKARREVDDRLRTVASAPSN